MKNERAEIIGGATLWARQTIESDIFLNKPDKWFKIWFYLVSRASHKDTKRYSRGEVFLQTEWIAENTGATIDQVKKCMGYLRGSEMIFTRRSTRGFWLKIAKYDHFQRLDNYYGGVKPPDEALEKHQRSTREAPRYYKNGKNDKNNKASAKASADAPMEIDEFISWCRQSKQRHINIIGEYVDTKRAPQLTTKGQWTSFLKRNMRPAKALAPFTDEQMGEALGLIEKADYIKRWTLETLLKYMEE